MQHISSSGSGRRIFRWLIPVLAVLVWLAIGGIGGPIFGKLSTVATNDQASFLPASADSTKVQSLESSFASSSSIPAIVVVASPKPLQPSAYPALQQLATDLRAVPGVATTAKAVVGPIPSIDQKAVEYIVAISSESKTKPIIDAMTKAVVRDAPSGTTGYVTGPAGLAAALVNAFSGIDSILIYVTLAAVFVILLLVYRSVVLPFLVLLTAMFALSAAGFLIYHGVQWGWFKLNGQSQGILSILVIGAATDYSLLLTARFREALEIHESKYQAMRVAVRGCLEPIVASGATVILGLLCLIFSDLNSNKSLGPIGAIGIAFAIVSALTFLPSILLLFGRGAFWPFRPRFMPNLHETPVVTGLEGRKGLWRRIPQLVANHSRAVWIACAVVLLVCAMYFPNFKASGVPLTATLVGKNDAVTGQTVLAAHFPAGSGSPVLIVVDASKAAAITAALQHTAGVASVMPASIPPTKSGQQPLPLVVNGKSLMSATLTAQADSASAKQTVRALRSSLPKIDPSVLIGGTTAVAIDSNDTAQADLRKIVPIVLTVILIILIFLLRSLVAPVLLIASVIVSYTATIGISAFVFNNIFNFAGSDAAIPLFGFIFLVALGVDYNIFLMTRVREESVLHGTRPGILRGLSVTGSVITSAGIVLAATFAALSVVPVLFLAQIAFIVAFGVLLDTIIVRSLLIPALCYDIDRRIWWPSILSRRR